MEKKHTPGPWVMNIKDKFVELKNGLAITDLNDLLVCTVSHNLEEISMREYLANASLITAAPALLAAVELLWQKVNLAKMTDEEITFVHKTVEAATKI